MSNQEAITLLRNLEDSLDSYCELNEEEKTAFRMAIEALNCSEFPNNSSAISRQAAIDGKISIQRTNGVEIYSDEAVPVEYLKSLPSAQPEQRWIPCSDENPKADGRYLITGKMGTVYSLDFEDGRWYGGIKPVAWMPLPEPYREDIE